MQKVKDFLSENFAGAEFELTAPPDLKLGDYATNIAFDLAKKENISPREAAEKVAKALEDLDIVEKTSVAGAGFVNIFLKDSFLQGELEVIAADSNYGNNESYKGKRVIVEYTDPNPFKQFHIGHLMTNVIGESIARLFEASGAEVLRVNYQGDVGVHVASSVWGMIKLSGELPNEDTHTVEKMAFLGRAYVLGTKAYKEEVSAKEEIDAINKKIYERSDAEIDEMYDRGREWSLDYFEIMYARLGTKFNHYFFESEVGPDGLEIVKTHPEIFIESQGAVIFPGEQYGLHNRVFINSLGLPTYEAKELGLNKRKFKEYNPDLSLIVTANEINEYFRVLLKAMELAVPEAASKTKHIGHGMLRLPTGKMSSRTGDVITAESLIDRVKSLVAEKVREREGLTDAEKEEIQEGVAMAAIRYSILKQGIGKDIIFDFEKSVAFTGDSGPYLQYTYARLENILKQAGENELGDVSLLKTPEERAIMRHLLDFPTVISRATETISPNVVALYIFELCDKVNRFYEEVRVLDDEDKNRRGARLVLVRSSTQVLRRGLEVLGIKALQRI